MKYSNGFKLRLISLIITFYYLNKPIHTSDEYFAVYVSILVINEYLLEIAIVQYVRVHSEYLEAVY